MFVGSKMPGVKNIAEGRNDALREDEKGFSHWLQTNGNILQKSFL